jgi:hypothetical protein
VSGRIVVTVAVALATLVLAAPAALAAAPTISSFTPTCGPVGTAVTITGTGFNDAPSAVSAVTFNGTAATSFTVNSDTQITATVPAGATTGTIAVTDSEGTATSSGTFTIGTGTAPTITSFTPTGGPIGTVVEITGTDLTGACSVTFGGVAATTFAVHSATHATATVPTGAVTGPIVIRTPSGMATSATSFEVTAATVEHDRDVSLTLRRHLVARGSVSSDAAVCEAGVSVDIQRRQNDSWVTVGSDETNANGRFRAPVNDRPGRYRALAAEVTIGSDVCLADASPRVRHRH